MHDDLTSMASLLAPLAEMHGFDYERNADLTCDFCTKEITNGQFVFGLTLCVAFRSRPSTNFNVMITSVDGLVLDNGFDRTPDPVAAPAANQRLEEIARFVRDELKLDGLRYLAWQPCYEIDHFADVAEAVAAVASVSSFIESFPSAVLPPPTDAVLVDAAPRETGQTLVAVLTEALRGRSMSVAESAQAALDAGYTTKAANFRVIVNMTLLKNPERFRKVARGVYTAV